MMAILLLLFFFCCIFCKKGLFFTDTEIKIWRERMMSGPFKTQHDAFYYSPGDFDRIEENAKEFLELGEGNDVWDENNKGHSVGVRIRDAGFYYLLTENATFADAVRKQVMIQVKVSAANYSNKAFLPNPGDGDEFFTCGVWARVLFAYDYTKDTFSEEEKLEVNEFLRRIGKWYVENSHHQSLKLLFPNRLNRSYVEKGNVANCDSCFTEGKYTHLNEQGEPMNKLYWVTNHYNNRKAAHFTTAALIGVFLNDSYIIDHCKLFAEEWLKFAVFRDGTMAEYMRNGNYDQIHSGIYYGAYLISYLSIFAESLARVNGDFSIYEYSTSDGIFTSIGGNKTLWLVIENHIRIYDESYTRYYYNKTDPVIRESHRLKSYWKPEGKSYTVRYMYDIYYAMANHYYKSDYYLNIYTRSNTSNVPKIEKNDRILGDGPYAIPWEGPVHIFPCIYCIFGDMEKYNIPYSSNLDETSPGNNIWPYFVVGGSIIFGGVFVSILIMSIIFVTLILLKKSKKKEDAFEMTNF